MLYNTYDVGRRGIELILGTNDVLWDEIIMSTGSAVYVSKLVSFILLSNTVTELLDVDLTI